MIPKRILLSAILIILAVGLGESSRAGEAKPNVVLILADDMGYSDLRCYGSEETNTPNLDRLAADGMRFTDFYAGSGVCSPSRACFLTGRFAVRAGVYSWIAPTHTMHLRVAETTIAEKMKEAGYATAHIGKWHLGYDLIDGMGDGPDPGDHGFDYWMATGNNANPTHHNPNNFVRNGKPVGETDGYSCQLVVDEAIRWLDKHRDPNKPFYLNIWFHEPHQRVAAPEQYRKRHLATRNPDYYGCIDNMDAAVGRLMDKIETMSVEDNTFVLFTSDNGSYMAGSNDPLKGRKTSLWEGGIREPGIIRWPGHIEAGSESKTPAGVVDILPTVCEVVGIAPPTDRTLDGVSLVPLFRGDEIKRNKPLYWFYNPSRPVCVIREGDWNLIADPELDLSRDNMFRESYIGDIKKTALVDFRLYNLREDPGQTTDLSEKHPERFEAMKRRMLELHEDVMEEAYDWRK